MAGSIFRVLVMQLVRNLLRPRRATATRTVFACPTCGADVPDPARFCATCGASISRSPQAELFASSSGEPPDLASLPVGFAGFWLRLAAAIIDGVVVTVLVFAATYVVEVTLPISADDVTASVPLIDLAVAWTYFATMESGPWQATVGKRALRLVVVDGRGARLSILRASGRYLGKYVSILLLGIGFIMAAFTARKQALHDLMADTVVLRRPPEPAGT